MVGFTNEGGRIQPVALYDWTTGSPSAAGGGGSLTATANAAAPTQTEGATVGLSTDLHTGLRVLVVDGSGAPVDYTTNVPTVGPTAADAALTVAPVTVGVRAATAVPAAVQDGDVVNLQADKGGALVTVRAARENVTRSAVVTLSASTTETSLIAAGGSGVFLDMQSIIICNTSATAARVDIRDDGTVGGGTISLALYVPAGDTRGVVFNVPFKQTTANKAWSVQSSASVTDLRITAQFVKNN